MLGEELEMQVRAYLTALRENGAVVNTPITIGCAEGIVKSAHCFDEALGQASPYPYGLCEKRRASTKAKIAIQNFDEVKAQFLLKH